MHTTTATIKKKKTRRLGNTRNIPLKCREEKKKKRKEKNREETKGMTSKERRKGERLIERGWMEKKKERGTTKNSSIYRHPISFPITRTSETGDLFGLFSYETFFGTISKEKSSLYALSTPAALSLPLHFSIPLHPGSPRFLHTRLRSILTETNIRIFVIPFAGYIESVFLSRKRTRRLSSLSSSPFLLPFDNWLTGRKKEGKVS